MNKLHVRIVNLEPLRVASIHGFGKEPEAQAWQKLTAWAGSRGYLDDQEAHPIFGFNNPNPSPGSPNYGYEFWIVVGPEVEADSEVAMKEFPGGLYAVTFCEVKNAPYDTIPATWKKLVAWREESRYKAAGHQWLEKHLSPEGSLSDDNFNLDLYLPIAE